MNHPVIQTLAKKVGHHSGHVMMTETLIEIFPIKVRQRPRTNSPPVVTPEGVCTFIYSQIPN
jgi:hypothetical protein